MGGNITWGIPVVWSIPEVAPVALLLLATIMEATAFFPLHTSADAHSSCRKRAAQRAAAQVIFQILYSRLFEILAEIKQAS